ncbi:MAG: PD-(D/E)XK nuclease family protein [Anaerolineales bacterium]
MPKLPSEFTFSQASLQDFLACPRRFYLRYVRRLAWPSAGGGKVFEWEWRLKLAQDFHHLAHQRALGIAAELLDPLVQHHSAELIEWWSALCQFWEAEQEGILLGRRFAELMLTAPLGKTRLLAKYDLLVAHPDGRWTIIDWKTTQRRPAADALRSLVQTRVYPYLLVRAGASLNEGHPIEPDQVTMIYWFANAPANPELIPYATQQFQADEDFLSHITEEILARKDEDFELTLAEHHCAYCLYRTYCERSFTPLADEDSEEIAERLELSLPQDWDQIAEVEY